MEQAGYRLGRRQPKTLHSLGLVVPMPDAHYVIQHAEYGFTANLPIEVVFADNFLLATHYDGKPLTPEHGAPLRGLVGSIPGEEDLKDVYLWKGAKWLRGLEFVAKDGRASGSALDIIMTLMSGWKNALPK